MPFDAQVIKVFIASPGDVRAFRDAVEQELHEWNSEHAEDYNIVLLPVRWEMSAVPRQGGDGQMQINRQLVDEADILLGIFHSRLGQPTPRAMSGTAEEIERMNAAGKPVHLYFCTASLPNNIDVDQLAGMRQLQTRLQATGLTADFLDGEALRRLVRRTMTSDARQVRRASEASGTVSHILEGGVVAQLARDPSRRRPLPELDELGVEPSGEFDLSLFVEKGFKADGSTEIEAEIIVKNHVDQDVYGLRGSLRPSDGGEAFMSFEIRHIAAGASAGVTLDYRTELRHAVADLVWHEGDSPGWHVAEAVPLRVSARRPKA